jgi:hypothetical protein
MASSPVRRLQRLGWGLAQEVGAGVLERSPAAAIVHANDQPGCLLAAFQSSLFVSLGRLIRRSYVRMFNSALAQKSVFEFGSMGDQMLFA